MFAQVVLMNHPAPWARRARIVHVPDRPRSDPQRFVEYIWEHVLQQTKDRPPSRERTLICCAAPQLIEAWSERGFSVHKMELTINPSPDLPWQLIERLAAVDVSALEAMAEPYPQLLASYDLTRQLQEIWSDPMLVHSGLTQNTARDYNVYARAFVEGSARKWQQLSKHVIAGRIVDLGCGPASLLAHAARDPLLHESDLHGVEINPRLVDQARLALREATAYEDAPNAFVHQANVLEPALFAPDSVSTTITASLTHEVIAYGSRRELSELAASIHRWTRLGGRWLNLDVCGLDAPDRHRQVQIQFIDSVMPAPYEDLKDLPVSRLDSAALLVRFAREFCVPFSVEWKPCEDMPIATCTMEQAHEFLLHKDYTDNWSSEMSEPFGALGFQDWKQLLSDGGWRVLDGSHAFTNEWIAEHRFATCCRLLDTQGNQIQWPVTSCLLVAQPATGLAAGLKLSAEAADVLSDDDD